MRTPASAAGAENARRETTRRPSVLPSFAAVPAFVVALAALPAGVLGQAPATAPVYETVIEPRRDPALPREDLTASASVITADRTPAQRRDLAQAPVRAARGQRHPLWQLRLAVDAVAARLVAQPGGGLCRRCAPGQRLDRQRSIWGWSAASVSQRIEVYRGQSPLAFGSSAMGGVVSITSEAPDRSGLQLESGAGSFATRHGGATAALVGRAGSLVARLNLFRSQADFPYHSDNGTLLDPADDQDLRRQNNDLDQLDAAVRGAVHLAAGRQLAAVAVRPAPRAGAARPGHRSVIPGPASPAPPGRERQL